MIDVENEIYTEAAERVREQYSDVFMTGEYVKSPSVFPCVSLVETDNTTLRDTLTCSGRENHATVLYELNVYSNLTSGKKAECKAIAAIIDEVLTERNFVRMMMAPIPNQDNATIYRITGRYRAVVSKNKTIYRR